MKLKNYRIYALLLVVIFLSGFKANCNKNKANSDKVYRQSIVELPRVTNPFSYVTNKGVVVKTINAMPENRKEIILSLVDAGITKLFETTASYNAPNASSYSDYIVTMIPETARTLDGNCPALYTKYNQKIAGTVIGIDSLDTPFIVIAQPFDDNDLCNQYLTNAIRFEGEHRKICANKETMRFYQTSMCEHFQGEFDSHPIIPDANGQ